MKIVNSSKVVRFICIAAGLALAGWLTSANAANEVKTKRIQVPVEENETAQDTPAVPAPQDDHNHAIPQDALPELKTRDADNVDGSADDDVVDAPQPQGPPPPILRDFSALPEPVQRMRTLILEAAGTGDIEKLRDLIGIGETATTLSIGGLEGDPIEFLKTLSGDVDGFEVLGILIEILETGYVHMDNGTDEEMYIWPYFFAYPLDKLTPEQNVELYTILTAGDVEDSLNFGGYVFYRVGIKPDGQWSFFVAGD